MSQYSKGFIILSAVLICALTVMFTTNQPAADTADIDDEEVIAHGHGGHHGGGHHGHHHHGHHHHGHHHGNNHGYWHGGEEWGGKPGYYSDPNYYYDANARPSVQYETPNPVPAAPVLIKQAPATPVPY